jgi:hypothetical protein
MEAVYIQIGIGVASLIFNAGVVFEVVRAKMKGMANDISEVKENVKGINGSVRDQALAIARQQAICEERTRSGGC